VAAAVERLESEGILQPAQARLFGRVARGELVSLATALRALLYFGVLAVTTGAGLLFKEEIAHLGPLSIAAGVGVAALACLTWVARVSAPYSPDELKTPHFAFDYVLGLGALLLALDLAFIEGQFATLGEAWPFHLLLVSLVYAALAFRFDSRTLFALSLTTFTAWRGVSATSIDRALFGFLGDTDAVRLNALGCGLAFLVLGKALDHRGIKAHFEPTATHLGWLLILQSIAWGIDTDGVAIQHRLALMAIGGGLAWFGWTRRRFGLFVFGVLAAYLGFMVGLADLVDEEVITLFFVGVSSIALVFGLAVLHRRFPRESEE